MSTVINQKNTAEKIGGRIGCVAALGGRLAYTAMKEGKDSFFKVSGNDAVENGLKYSTGVGVKAATAIFVATAFALGGKIIGSTIGKLIDKHNQKKDVDNSIK